jgi:class 3 adenylate cyclase
VEQNSASILVVDDNDDNRYTLTRRLKRLGYGEVEIAENGRIALEKIHRQAFDLVLLDIMMPEVNGYEVLEQIKSHEDLRHLPVIMISAVDEIDSIVKCIKMGAEDYLSKPFNPVLLAARVGATLEKKQLRDQEARHLEQLAAEKKRGDDLLHAMLPANAVHELIETDRVQPRRFEDVTVLFCDIVGFTRYCDAHSPEQVVAELQALVGGMEDIAARNGLEKIKTVGDAFLATAGLLEANDDPVTSAVRCGLEMAALSQQIEPHWQVRIGLHAGPVVAGIVGRHKFLYDLWGDTVNVAARITEQAAPGTVCASAETWARTGGIGEQRSLGAVEIKGKGAIELVEIRSLG